MAELTSSSAYDVKIESVILDTDRLQEDYEISPIVSEINIFENVDLPYLTGNILISDTTQLFTRVGFQGTERITMTLRINGDDTAKPITKTFIVTDVKVVPAQDTAEVMLLNLIEDHAFLDRLVTVSKAYDGKPEIITAKILKDGLGRDVEVPKDFVGSASSSMRVVVPNMSPLNAARWMKDRIVSTNGMPFFLYSTLNGPNLFLTDLEYMLAENPINQTRPYAYGQAFNRWSASRTVLDQARNIESYSLPKSENMYGLAASGVLNSTYEFVDTVKKRDARFSSVKVSMEDVLDRMVSSGIITDDQRGPIYDSQFTINDKTIAEYNPSVLTQITPSNTFTGHANYYESEDIEQQKLKSIARALRYYLLKSPIEISMPGFDYLGRGDNSTIGRQISVNFLKNDPNILLGDAEALDKKRSGKYLIYACRHIIRPEKYMVTMACVKLANQQNG